MVAGRKQNSDFSHGIHGEKIICNLKLLSYVSILGGNHKVPPIRVCSGPHVHSGHRTCIGTSVCVEENLGTLQYGASARFKEDCG